MANQFFVYLPSNTPKYLPIEDPNLTADYPSNKPNKYRVRLPKKVSFNGSWVCGLHSISYPYSWPSTVGTLDDQFINVHFTDRAGKLRTLKIPIPKASHSKVEELRDFLASALKKQSEGVKNIKEGNFLEKVSIVDRKKRDADDIGRLSSPPPAFDPPLKSPPPVDDSFSPIPSKKQKTEIPSNAIPPAALTQEPNASKKFIQTFTGKKASSLPPQEPSTPVTQPPPKQPPPTQTQPLETPVTQQPQEKPNAAKKFIQTITLTGKKETTPPPPPQEPSTPVTQPPPIETPVTQPPPEKPNAAKKFLQTLTLTGSPKETEKPTVPPPKVEEKAEKPNAARIFINRLFGKGASDSEWKGKGKEDLEAYQEIIDSIKLEYHKDFDHFEAIFTDPRIAYISFSPQLGYVLGWADAKKVENGERAKYGCDLRGKIFLILNIRKILFIYRGIFQLCCLL
jgi:hypothetical protein